MTISVSLYTVTAASVDVADTADVATSVRSTSRVHEATSVITTFDQVPVLVFLFYPVTLRVLVFADRVSIADLLDETVVDGQHDGLIHLNDPSTVLEHQGRVRILFDFAVE